jgi:hypothetical protein
MRSRDASRRRWLSDVLELVSAGPVSSRRLLQLLVLVTLAMDL